MAVKTGDFPEKPSIRPQDPRFSSGPCKKFPGWDAGLLNTSFLGRSHRAKNPKARLTSAIERSRDLLNLPADWKLGIVPGSDTGAFEIALWSMLGLRAVDVLIWDSFSSDWANDLVTLGIEKINPFKADYGALPALEGVDDDHDLVFVYNGTTSGVCLPDLNWLSAEREGLVFCDATSAVYAMPIDFTKLDVVSWSWQKVLGGEGGHGMLALSPSAVERLGSYKPPRPLPKLFRLTRNGKLVDGIFSGATINTPSILAVEDLHLALDWAESIGGLSTLWQRTRDNFDSINDWVQRTSWIDWLASDAKTRSPTSMCLKIVDPEFVKLPGDEQQKAIDLMTEWLEQENCALDIGNYRSAPPGFRIWGGATVDTSDLLALGPWLDWAYARYIQHSRGQE